MNTQPSINPAPTGRPAPRMLQTSKAPRPKASSASVMAWGSRLVGPGVRNGAYIMMLSTITKIVVVRPISRQPGAADGPALDRAHSAPRHALARRAVSGPPRTVAGPRPAVWGPRPAVSGLRPAVWGPRP